MKITQQKLEPAFEPIMVVLETRQEGIDLYNVLKMARKNLYSSSPTGINDVTAYKMRTALAPLLNLKDPRP